MRILFVCIGNICRSPIAEGVLKSICQQKKLDWEIDSAGTHNYHVGEAPHPNSQLVCQQNDINISQQKARQFDATDFDNFDIIYALATDVNSSLTKLSNNKAHLKKVKLLLDEIYPNQNKSVKDPWYGEFEDYEDVFAEITLVCDAIAKKYA